MLAVATAAYLAAVYPRGRRRAARRRRRSSERSARARWSPASLAGAVALAGLVVLHSDAHPSTTRCSHGAGLPALIVSVRRRRSRRSRSSGARRFEPARYTAALAVAAIIAGWALAQQPMLLPGPDGPPGRGAARHARAASSSRCSPAARSCSRRSALLFRLTLSGQLDHDERPATSEPGTGGAAQRQGQDCSRLAAACLIAGVGFLTHRRSWLGAPVGVIALLGFIAIGFIAATPAEIAKGPPEEQSPRS